MGATMMAWHKDQNADCVVHIGSFESGLCSVAAPVFDMSGTAVAAISATKVAESVPDAIKSSVIESGMTISRGLGWTQPTLMKNAPFGA